MSQREVAQSVIGMLTICVEILSEASSEDELRNWPPQELRSALRAPTEFRGDATVEVSGDPVPLSEVRELLNDAARQGVASAEAHYANVLGCLTMLFLQLADEARPVVDVQEFLQRQALALAADADEPG